MALVYPIQSRISVKNWRFGTPPLFSRSHEGARKRAKRMHLKVIESETTRIAKMAVEVS